MDLPLALEENTRYFGTYDLGDLEVRVFEQEGALMAQATNQRALRMKYQGEHTFVLDAPQSIKLVFELLIEGALPATWSRIGSPAPEPAGVYPEPTSGRGDTLHERAESAQRLVQVRNRKIDLLSHA